MFSRKKTLRNRRYSLFLHKDLSVYKNKQHMYNTLSYYVQALNFTLNFTHTLSLIKLKIFFVNGVASSQDLFLNIGDVIQIPKFLALDKLFFYQQGKLFKLKKKIKRLNYIKFLTAQST